MLTDYPIQGAAVFPADKTGATTDAEGRFSINDIPAGFKVVGASADGYSDQHERKSDYSNGSIIDGDIGKGCLVSTL